MECPLTKLEMLLLKGAHARRKEELLLASCLPTLSCACLTKSPSSMLDGYDQQARFQGPDMLQSPSACKCYSVHCQVPLISSFQKAHMEHNLQQLDL